MPTPKESRTLKRVSDCLFAKKSFFVPISLKDIPRERFFSHQFRLPGNRLVFLTDSGYEHFRRIVEIVDRSNTFEGLADFTDIWDAWLGVATKWLSEGVKPDGGDEIIRAITAVIDEKIDEHTLTVPVFGVDLAGSEAFRFGSITMLQMSADVLDAIGVDHKHTNVARAIEHSPTKVWLQGTIRGTKRVAEKRFSKLALSTTGVLAIAAASMYQYRTARFRIGVAMAPEAGASRSIWFSWSERARILATHYAAPSAHAFPLVKSLGTSSDLVKMIHCAQNIVENREQSEVARAISKSIFWYSDAHRDSEPVMKFVKYWSCVEVFFSFENEDITHSVSSGLTSMLVFGGFKFVELSDYSELKAEIKHFYAYRSRAVHGASHDHITEGTVARFGQLVAWMIVTVVALTERGYTTLEKIMEQVKRLDEQVSQVPDEK